MNAISYIYLMCVRTKKSSNDTQQFFVPPASRGRSRDCAVLTFRALQANILLAYLFPFDKFYYCLQISFPIQVCVSHSLISHRKNITWKWRIPAENNNKALHNIKCMEQTISCQTFYPFRPLETSYQGVFSICSIFTQH